MPILEIQNNAVSQAKSINISSDATYNTTDNKTITANENDVANTSSSLNQHAIKIRNGKEGATFPI